MNPVRFKAHLAFSNIGLFEILQVILAIKYMRYNGKYNGGYILKSNLGAIAFSDQLNLAKGTTETPSSRIWNYIHLLRSVFKKSIL